MKKIDVNEPEARSADIVAGNVAQLKALFPEAFSEGKVDLAVIKQLLGETAEDQEEKFGLNWHGKRRARQPGSAKVASEVLRMWRPKAAYSLMICAISRVARLSVAKRTLRLRVWQIRVKQGIRVAWDAPAEPESHAGLSVGASREFASHGTCLLNRKVMQDFPWSKQGIRVPWDAPVEPESHAGLSVEQAGDSRPTERAC